MMELKKYEKNVTSQWGEDGVIEEIFNRIGDGNKLCCEFGAWDGKHLSNCWDLWHNKEWNAVLIEGEADRVANLKVSLAEFKNVKPVLRFVDPEGVNSVDQILDDEGIDSKLDLLSIDIDSDDYAVFQHLKRTPRLIVIEYNPTIPPHIDLVQKKGENLGNSISAIFKLAQTKGYKFIHLTYTNMFLVHESEFEKLNLPELDYYRVFPYDKLTCVINTYGGDTLLSQPMPYAKWLEPADVGMRKYLSRKYLGKDKPSFPAFDSDGDIQHIKIINK